MTKVHKSKQSKSTDAIAASVEKLYNKSAPLLVAEALLLGIIAIFMAFKPLAVLTTLMFVLGCGLILFGLYRAIAGFVAARPYGGGWVDVIFGLVNVVLGVLFLVYPAGSMIALLYVFLVLFLFKALRALIFAINMARARFGHWVFDLVVALALCALAIALLFWPMAGAVAVVYWLAITMLFYAAADVYMFIELRQLKKAVDD
ncbi:MAG: DUF308 domain-containing protein [Alphaproteobacteria bacterium]|nr:DUF308 domain-containing protein [Alphaproteobacteria bacterium]MBQ8473280.1 DUF308 domain-containing protein [Alphaproteobacteria bacterium]